MPTYTITRFFMKGGRETVDTGLSLDEAQEHCEDPENSSTTCTSDEGLDRTAARGPWFDGYDKE